VSGFSGPPWWLYPLLMCLVLTGIHGYLGIHVLKRKVIFVDLAMAQIAALGAAYAILLGYTPQEDPLAVYCFSLGFTLVGAAVIALSRMRREKIPHEAFIGIVYASASAIAMLLLAKTRSETDQLKHMLAGSLLTVEASKVWVTAAIYAGIGLFHWAFRAKFFAISEDPEAAEKAGISLRFWDFLFYVSFGVVITSSVSIAGVLLVFSYLVVPGVIAVMFADGTRGRVAIAWGVGTAVSVVGMIVSYKGDFAPGPPIVASFAAALIVAGLVHYVASSDRSGMAVGRLAAGGVVVALAIYGTTFLRRGEESHGHHADDAFSQLVEALKSKDDGQVLPALDHIARTKDAHAVDPVIEVVRTTKSDQALLHAAEALVALEAVKALPALHAAAARDVDSDLRVHLAQAILDLRDPSGFAILIRVLEQGPPRITADEALALVEHRTGRKMDLAALKAWWSEKGPSLRWRTDSRRFE